MLAAAEGLYTRLRCDEDKVGVGTHHVRLEFAF